MTVAARYAKAALAVAQQAPATFPRFTEAVAALTAAVAQAQVAAALHNPRLGLVQRRQLATLLAKAVEAPPALANLLQLLAQRGRLAQTQAILQAIEAEIARQAGLTNLVVHTAQPLTEAQKISLKVQVKAYTKAKDVRLQQVLKPELMGGFRAFFGGLVWDMSLQGGLARLSAKLQQAIQ